ERSAGQHRAVGRRYRLLLRLRWRSRADRPDQPAPAAGAHAAGPGSRWLSGRAGAFLVRPGAARVDGGGDGRLAGTVRRGRLDRGGEPATAHQALRAVQADLRGGPGEGERGVREARREGDSHRPPLPGYRSSDLHPSRDQAHAHHGLVHVLHHPRLRPVERRFHRPRVAARLQLAGRERVRLDHRVRGPSRHSRRGPPAAVAPVEGVRARGSREGSPSSQKAL
ncbi:MAG: hypothetical protein AVDCRST_MAG78-2709, partial [uncultured Rubrobacteraceae bacterium]